MVSQHCRNWRSPWTADYVAYQHYFYPDLPRTAAPLTWRKCHSSHFTPPHSRLVLSLFALIWLRLPQNQVPSDKADIQLRGNTLPEEESMSHVKRASLLSTHHEAA